MYNPHPCLTLLNSGKKQLCESIIYRYALYFAVQLNLLNFESLLLIPRGPGDVTVCLTFQCQMKLILLYGLS